LQVWVDADACPVAVRDLIIKAAQRLSVKTVFVANKQVVTPFGNISFVQVLPGLDEADKHIAEHAEPGDLVVTQDIPLAAQLVPLGITVISPRGDSYNPDNIGEALASRNLMDELRSAGTVTTSQKPFDHVLKRQFANRFDAALTALLRKAR
jgi:uncharacterized protein